MRFAGTRAVPGAAALAILAGTAQAQSQGSPRVQAIRFWSFGDVTRVAIQTQGDYKLDYDQLDNPPRLYFDLNGLRPPAHGRGVQITRVDDRYVKQIRLAEISPRRTRVVFDLTGPVEVVSSQLVDPDRLIIEIRPKGTTVAALSAAHAIVSPGRGDTSATSVSKTSETSRDLSVPATDKPPLEGTAVGVQPSTISGPPQVSTIPKLDVPKPGVNAVINSAVDSKFPPPPVASQPRDGSLVANASPTAISRSPGLPGVTATPAGISGITAAKRDSAGDRSLVRIFGLKLSKVVIDAGHGGHDTGTIGPNGLTEKDLVLDVALRLGKLIRQRLGADVVYTRTDDVFIPLEQRTKIADEEKADLFISIHANSSPEPSATGVETYYFNLTSDKAGVDLAMRENAGSGSSISDLNEMLHKAVLQTKMEESREFAQKVQASLSSMSIRMNSHARDRGVRQAPFVVLIGATMPSILAEIGFVSNPHDANLMRRSDQRQKIAEALFKGISQYASSLSRMQIARTASE